MKRNSVVQVPACEVRLSRGVASGEDDWGYTAIDFRITKMCRIESSLLYMRCVAVSIRSDRGVTSPL